MYAVRRYDNGMIGNMPWIIAPEDYAIMRISTVPAKLVPRTRFFNGSA